MKSRFTGKDPDAGKYWRQEDKGITEKEMAEWHHWLSGLEFEQTQGDGEGQGSLVCCTPGVCKELDMSEQLKNNKIPHLSSLWLIGLLSVWSLKVCILGGGIQVHALFVFEAFQLLFRTYFSILYFGLRPCFVYESWLAFRPDFDIRLFQLKLLDTFNSFLLEYKLFFWNGADFST